MGYKRITQAIHPETRDVTWVLSPGAENYRDALQFIDSHYHAGYSISFFDVGTGETIDILHTVAELQPNVPLLLHKVLQAESSSVLSVGEDSIHKKYFISMRFEKKALRCPAVYELKNRELVHIADRPSALNRWR